jgi:hypothetical protein
VAWFSDLDFVWTFFCNKLFLRWDILAPRPTPRWRTTPCRLSANACSVCSQLLSSCGGSLFNPQLDLQWRGDRDIQNSIVKQRKEEQYCGVKVRLVSCTFRWEGVQKPTGQHSELCVTGLWLCSFVTSRRMEALSVSLTAKLTHFAALHLPKIHLNVILLVPSRYSKWLFQISSPKCRMRFLFLLTSYLFSPSNPKSIRFISRIRLPWLVSIHN